MAKEEEIANAAVEHASATAEMKAVSDYLNRGRSLEGVPVEELKGIWVDKFRVWAADGSGRMEYDDAEAELKLRTIEPPYELVKPELDALVERTKIATMQDGAAERIGSSIMSDYADEIKKQN